MATPATAPYRELPPHDQGWYQKVKERLAAWAIDSERKKIEPVPVHPLKPRPSRIAQFAENWKGVQQRIVESRTILDLADDWDSEGSIGYSAATWERAVAFLRTQVTAAHRMGMIHAVPQINPADEGSIDLFWQIEGKSLLINFPASPDELATYFGQDEFGNTVAGMISYGAERLDLIAWLDRSR